MNNLLDLTMRLYIFKLSDSPLCFFNNCFLNQIWHFLICYHRPPFLAFPNNQVVKFLNVLITYCFSLNWKIITPRNDTVLCSWIYIRTIVLFSSYYSSMLCLNNLPLRSKRLKTRSFSITNGNDSVLKKNYLSK